MINVTDVNDNHPVFIIPSGGYNATVSEDISPGSEVITVIATDRDTGASQINYSFSNSSVPFQFEDPTIGRITVSTSLDRELQSQYTIIVVAEDTHLDSGITLQVRLFYSLL